LFVVFVTNFKVKFWLLKGWFVMKRFVSIFLVLMFVLAFSSGCGESRVGDAGEGGVVLDPGNPVTIVVWHYYNGPLLNAFQASIKEFNETIGLDKGIIVEGLGHGSVSELESAVMDSANKEIGSMDMPNIFASFADTAYQAEKMGLLADLGDYFSSQEQAEYLESFIEEGRIGLNGELRIFPIAKATEVLMVNETDWLPFAAANGVSYDDLSTVQGITRVAELYYEWSGGRPLFGRDAIANMFIAASRSFGTEIFEVSGGVGTINVDRDVMRLIWDNYYVPYISGCFFSYGRFSSDDAKVGDILMYVGSTSSAAFFPTEVTADGSVYPVVAKVLPAPVFEGGENVMVQQGAGMVVTKSSPEQELASVEFLKWFTDTQQNIEFAVSTGYVPVKLEALDYDLLKSHLDGSGIEVAPIVHDTLSAALGRVSTNELYTNKAFDGGADARKVLENDLQDMAATDRAAVEGLIDGGLSREDAVAMFDTEERFELWVDSLTAQLLEAVAG